MFDWFKKSKPRTEPLRGAPPVRRQKTYSAQSGYVYQYFYEGYRPAGTSTEYVFDVTADRKTPFAVSVLIACEAVMAWQGRHQRDLNTTEQYAIAKMALFEAFDERENPERMRDAIPVSEAYAEELLARLGIEA